MEKHRWKTEQKDCIAELHKNCVKDRRIITIIQHILEDCHDAYRTENGLLAAESTSVLVGGHETRGIILGLGKSRIILTLVDTNTDLYMQRLLSNWREYEERAKYVNVDPSNWGSNISCESLALKVEASGKDPDIFKYIKPFELQIALVVGRRNMCC